MARTLYVAKGSKNTAKKKNSIEMLRTEKNCTAIKLEPVTHRLSPDFLNNFLPSRVISNDFSKFQTS